jgi:hypothetical protein
MCKSIKSYKTILLSAAMLGANGVYAQSSISTGQLSGQDEINTITTAVPFLMIAPDSRAGGLGDAGVATSPDANSIHWNPAKLAMIDKKMGLSISYTPWLRALVPDINLAYLSGYYKVKKDQTFAGSLRYFSLGNITFTDITGSVIRDYKPNEFAVDGAYARKFSDRWSGGMAMRFIYSNLTGGVSVGGAETHAGKSFAVDIAGYYRNDDIKLGDKDGVFNAGLNLSNIGAKMSYSDRGAEKDFIPINMRLGTSVEMALDQYNTISFVADINKLLVPTPPITELDTATGQHVIIAGKDPDRAVVSGIFGSFNDAPGGFKEEMREFTISTGLEYWYDKQFAVRAGYFYENPLKGNRQFFTVGLGLKYNVFGLDLAYLIPTQQRNPLENTLRFTLLFDFDAFKSQGKDDSAK